jgi:signal transduction histidine kinase
LETLYHLNQMGDSSHQEICDFVLEQGVLLTQSEFGYLFFMNDEETILTVHSWSAAAMAICTVTGRPCVYRVVDTGLWGDAVRLRRPVITNDYAGSPRRRGLPEGHVPIRRHMNIPVFDGERIVAVAGVANKIGEYGEKDVRQLELLMKGMWRYIQRKNAQEALQASEEKLRQLTTQLLAAQEKERKRISIELHDELGQGLLTLKLQLRAMERKLSDPQKDLRADFQHVFRHINSVTEEVRRLSRDLSPSILEDLGLVAALHWLTKRIGKHHYIEMRCDIDVLGGVYAPEKELILFRIFQEALTNVAKHARTRHAEIRAESVGDQFVLTIEDQGQGFDMERIMSVKASDRGLGLAAMDERVRMLEGKLEITTRDNGGTRLRITVPHPTTVGR